MLKCFMLKQRVSGGDIERELAKAQWSGQACFVNA
jgi:hypothetical protein